jgi:hypothetical protein
MRSKADIDTKQSASGRPRVSAKPDLSVVMKLGPIGACSFRACLFRFERTSHKHLVFMYFIRYLASEKIAGRQGHTTSPSASAPFVESAPASTASRPALMTLRNAPRLGRDASDMDLIWG